jgi:hypothetical protein
VLKECGVSVTSHRRRTGAAAGAVVALAVLPGLASCTPADRPVVAIAYREERPTLLTVDCPDYKVDSVHVYPDAADDRSKWVAETDSRPGPGQMPLLEAPPGWTVTDRTLGELKPGVGYTLTAYSDARPAISLHFTVDQAGDLGPGEVLSGEPGSDTEVMSEQKFREQAEDSC